MRWRILCRFPLWIVLVALLGSCGGGGGGGGTPAAPGGEPAGGTSPSAEQGSGVFGTVRDSDGNPLARVPVEVAVDRDGNGLFGPDETSFAVTDAAGLYQLEIAPGGLTDASTLRARITVMPDGFFPLQRAVDLRPAVGPARVDFVVRRGVEVPVQEGRIVAEVPVARDGGTGRVEISLDSLEEPLPEGTVARVAYINPEDMMDSFPGDLSGRDAAGNDAMLASAGVVEVEVRDPEGRPLDPKGTITIRSPVPEAVYENLADADPATSDRIEVPLWWYDDQAGRWVQAQEYGYIVDADGSPVPPSRLFDIVFGLDSGGPYWIEGTVPHLSSWNWDFSGPVAGFAGELSGAVGSAAVCAGGGVCVPVGPGRNKFIVPFPKPGDQRDLLQQLADILSGLGEESLGPGEGPEPPGEGADGSGCPDYEAVVSRSLERTKSQAKHLLREMLSKYGSNDEVRNRVARAYTTIHRAGTLRDISKALKYVREGLPNVETAKKYGANFMAYFESETYHDLLNSLTSTMDGLEQLYKSFGSVHIKSCGEVASNILNIKTDLKDILEDEYKKFLQANGDFPAYINAKGRFDDWWKGAVQNLVGNRALVECMKTVTKHLGDLPKDAKIVELVKTLKTALGEEFVITGSQGKQILDIGTLFKGKTVDGSGVLLGLLLDEIFLAVKQKKEIAPKALDFEYWQRLSDTIHGIERVSARFAAHYHRKLEKGDISRGCYEKIAGLLRQGERAPKRGFRSAGEETGDDEALEAIESAIRTLEAESPEAAEIVNRLYYHFLTVSAAGDLLESSRILQGKIERYDRWTDVDGNPVDAPADMMGGGRTTRLYLIDSWGFKHILRSRATGELLDRVGVPNEAGYRGDWEVRFRDLGDLEVADSLHRFRGRLVGDGGEPITGWITVKWRGRRTGCWVPGSGRFEFTASFEAGDQLTFYAGGVRVAQHILSEADLDRETYVDIPVTPVLRIAGVDFVQEGGRYGVGFRIRYEVLPVGSVASAFASARLVTVQSVDTGEVVLDAPVTVGLDGSGHVELDGPGRYLFSFEVVDGEGRTATHDAVFVLREPTIHVDSIEVLSDLSTYTYGDPIRVRVKAWDEKGLPLRYRWAVTGAGDTRVLRIQTEDPAAPSFTFTPDVAWDPGTRRAPALRVSVVVSGPADEQVATAVLELPTPEVKPSAALDVTAVYWEGRFEYTIQATGAASGVPNLIVSGVGLTDLDIRVDGTPQEHQACNGAHTCTARHVLTLTPGPHTAEVVVADNQGEVVSRRVAFEVPASLEFQADPDPADDLRYTARAAVAYSGGVPVGGIEYSWSFDGVSWTDPSPEDSTEHVFDGYGYYWACVRLLPADGVPITAAFPMEVLPHVRPIVSVRSGLAPLTVRFSVEDGGGLAHVTGFRWDPQGTANPDELPVSRDPSYEFTYTEPGVYAPRVFLGVGEDAWIPMPLAPEPLTVDSPVSLEVDASPAEGEAPLSVTFTASADVPASSYTWDFDGDGAADLTTGQPVAEHTFEEPGRYHVVVAGVFPTGRYIAAVDITVGGSATVVLSDGLRPLAGLKVFQLSLDPPFHVEAEGATDDQGRYTVAAPAAVGFVHTEPDYTSYRIHYVGDPGIHTITDARLLDAVTTFSGLNMPGILWVHVYGSSGSQVFSGGLVQDGRLAVRNRSDLCYTKDGGIYGVYVVDVAQQAAPRAMPYMALPATHSVYIVPDVRVEEADALVPLAGVPEATLASLEITFSDPDLGWYGVEAFAQIQGVPVPVRLPVVETSGSAVTLPVTDRVESVRLVCPVRKAGWGSAGVVTAVIGRDVLSALEEDGEASVQIPVEARTVAVDPGWVVAEMEGATQYPVANVEGTIQVVAAAGSQDPVRLRIQPAGEGPAPVVWEVAAALSDLPTAWTGRPVGVGLDGVSVEAHPDAEALEVRYLPDGAAACDLTVYGMGDELGGSLDLRAVGLPATLSDITFVPLGEGPWFTDEAVTDLGVSVRCCDNAGGCVEMDVWPR